MTWGVLEIGSERCLSYDGTIAVSFPLNSTLRQADIEGWATVLNHHAAVPEPMPAAGTIKRECYEIAEHENSNLRKCLAWAGFRLSAADRAALAGMIRRGINDGGAVEDSSDDALEEIDEIKRLCVKAAGLLRDQEHDTQWWALAEDVANKLMEFDPPSPENLAALRRIAGSD